jgi:diguanylate cyclase (GGDEF)-like protein
VLGLATVVQAVLQAVPASAYMTDVEGAWLMGGNVLGSTLLALGVRLQAVGASAGASAPDRRAGRPYSLLPYGAMAATWALALGMLLADGLSLRSWVVAIGMMMTTALVVGRQVAAFRHIAELLRERDELTARLTDLAFHDGLTGLPNRALFMKRLTDGLAAGPVTVFLIDLDRFKPVNDAHGHATGDRLLVEVADRLRAAVRAGDTVARLGGDEFAVLIAGSAGDRLPTLAAALRGSARLGEHVVSVSASIGMAHGSGDPDRLLHEADMAMYAAKRGAVTA